MALNGLSEVITKFPPKRSPPEPLFVFTITTHGRGLNFCDLKAHGIGDHQMDKLMTENVRVVRGLSVRGGWSPGCTHPHSPCTTRIHGVLAIPHGHHRTCTSLIDTTFTNFSSRFIFVHIRPMIAYAVRQKFGTPRVLVL